MNSKVLVGIVAVVVVVAVAGVVVWSLSNEEVTVGVIYDGNGGVNSSGGSTVSDSSHTVDKNFFTKDGMVFMSWNTAADGSGTEYNPGDSIDYPSNGNVRLYAQWGYALSLTESYVGPIEPLGISFYLIDSEGENQPVDFLNAMALSLDGRAGIAVVGGSGTTWTYDSAANSFTSSGAASTITVTLSGITTASHNIQNNVAAWLFTYDGPVSGTVSIYVSN